MSLTWLRLLTLSILSSRNWAELTKDADRLWLLIVVVSLLLLRFSMDEMMSIAATDPWLASMNAVLRSALPAAPQSIRLMSVLLFLGGL
jgi:hypothetical protein